VRHETLCSNLVIALVSLNGCDENFHLSGFSLTAKNSYCVCEHNSML